MFNLFKGKKKEFYLELDDSDTAPVVEAPKPAEAPKPEPVKVEAPQPVETKVAEPAPKPEAEVKTKKKSPRAKKLEALKQANEQPQAAPEPQPTAQSAPQPVAAVASSSNGKAQPQGSPNFATKYFIPMNTPRRRPGPSLNKYKDIASERRKSTI